ncbi:protein FAR1-RELATED SEQUENCE 5-like [Medicago truncatula]|uniref:protein FAR1-RELATED SEQUENCE 5-like n=1 Tax=Medicago truncatula TaxID=3880 RepID=UPI0019682C4E|nr:protein FAR1-RELATED SEQUENCE 5-like [Medicago truncatula]
MDMSEILEIFQVSNMGNITGEGNIGEEGSESVVCSSDDDTEDTFNSMYECSFDDEFAVDCTTNFEKINFKELTYDEIMMYHFPDRVVAFKFYNMYGCAHGFAGRRSRVVKNKDGDVIQQSFVCHREGLRDARNLNTRERKREHKPTTRCGCMAKIQVHVDNGSNRWYIKMFDDIHNHTFFDEKYEGMLPAHRKMSDYDKFQMKAMRKAGIPTSRIYGFFASQAGGFKNLGYSKRTIYNEQFKERERKTSDADEAVEFLKELSRTDDMMYWRHTVNEDGTLQHLFWCDGVSRMDYKVFGDVLAFDATYRKIRYNTSLVIFSGVNHHNQSVIFGSAIVGDETEVSYVWLLQQFLEAMDGKAPVSVITDGDLSLRNAIRSVFPHAHHRLCAWHLARNASSNIKNPKFVPKFKQCMFGDFDIQEFESRWVNLVAEFELENNRWIHELYEKRHQWSTAHIRGTFYVGYRTTSRCEGLHSEFGKYVTVLSNLVDFLNHFIRWLSYVRYREIEADYASSIGETVLQTQHKSLESSAAKNYTRSVFKLFRPVLERACRCKIEGTFCNGSIFHYIVFKYPRDDIHWTVSYCQERLTFECFCKRLETYGVPCEHIVAVLVKMNIRKLPESVVLERWTRRAKDVINAENGNSSTHRDPAFVTTYVMFLERCKRMANAVLKCGNPNYIHKTMEMVEQHTEKLESYNRGEVDEMFDRFSKTGTSLGNPHNSEKEVEQHPVLQLDVQLRKKKTEYA